MYKLNHIKKLRFYNQPLYKIIARNVSDKAGILNKLLTKSIDDEFYKPDNYKILISKEYDDVYHKLTEIKNSTPKTTVFESIREQCKDFFRLFVPQEYGGMCVEYTNLACLIERLGIHTDVSYFAIVNQLLCIQTLLNYGSDAQKDKYLAKMTSGECFGAFCLTEFPSGSNIMLMEGNACVVSNSPADGDTKFVIHSCKKWILNAHVMDVCFVFVRTRRKDGTWAIGGFIVDQPLKMPDKVKLQPCQNVLNVPNVFSVHFDGVTVGQDCLIGGLDKGFKIANSIQNRARFAVSASLLGLAKLASNRVAASTLPHSSVIDRHLLDCAAAIHGAETALYFSTNVTDDWPDISFDLEFAATKIRSSVVASRVIQHCLEVARLTNHDQEYYQSIQAQITALRLFLGGDDVLRMFIGGSVLRVAAKDADVVDQMNSLRRQSARAWHHIVTNAVQPPPHRVEAGLRHTETFLTQTLHTVHLEAVKSFVKYGYNLPNQYSMVAEFAETLVLLYTLLAVHNRYQLLQKPDENVEILECERALRFELLALLGTTPNDGLAAGTAHTKRHGVAKVVHKSATHGIESAITRNW